MSHRWLIAYLLGVVALCASEIPTAPVPAGIDLARAVALTKTWEDDQPQRATRLLRVVYWTPADREPAPGSAEATYQAIENWMAAGAPCPVTQ